MIRILDFDKLSDECDYLVKSTDIELICYGMYDEEYTSKSFKINSFLASNIVKANEDIYYSNRGNAKTDARTKCCSISQAYSLPTRLADLITT